MTRENPVDLSEPTAGTEHILELACVNCFHLLVDNEITVHEICKHQRSEASDRLAKKLFDQMTEVVPRSSLWPVAVGLLRHLLLHPKATLQKYQYGVCAMTDVLRDAGDLLQGRGEAVPNIDLHELSRLRRRNLRL